MGKLSFFFKEAFGSLRRNYFMTIAALVTVFLSIVVLGVVLVFVFTTNELLGGVEQKVQINVFFKRDPDPTPGSDDHHPEHRSRGGAKWTRSPSSARTMPSRR